MAVDCLVARVRSSRARALAAVVALAALASVAAAAERKDTYLAMLLGEHAGTWVAGADGSGYRETLRLSAVQGDGRSVILESIALLPDGAGWRWERRVRAGTINTVERGAIADGTLWRDGAGKARTALGPLPADAVLPSMRAGIVRTFGLAGAKARREFVYLDLSRLRVVPVRLESCAPDPALADAARCVAWLPGAPGGEERWQLAGDGRVLRIDADLGGLPLRLEACTQRCDRPVRRPFDMIGALGVKSPYRISKRLAQGKLRYVLARADGQRPRLVRTGEQAVVYSGTHAVATVCRTCGDAVAETPDSLAPYLRANPWVRSDDTPIRRMAHQAGPASRSVPARMNKLVRAVQLHMREDPDYLGYADAVQALRTGRGDCTEFAVLLAALARAQGIPARIAVGMAYSSRFIGYRDTYTPHAWVQVYDAGRWVSYDAALEGFDATHVALAVGTGEPQEVFDAYLQLRQLRIERLGAVVR
jgi:hypothetical protein